MYLDGLILHPDPCSCKLYIAAHTVVMYRSLHYAMYVGRAGRQVSTMETGATQDHMRRDCYAR